MKRIAHLLVLVPMTVALLVFLYTRTAATAEPSPSAEPQQCSIESTSVESQAEPEPLCGKCGDGACVRSCGETATTCPADCGWAL